MAVEDALDIFGGDPFGRDYLYGLSTGQERLGLQPPPQGLQLDTRPYDQMQATPRGFTSGLFSDVLGRTLNMPSMPRTGIPALDLLSPNMNLLNRLSFGDLQKTADRISYGEPLSTGQGMTLRPKDETVGAALTLAPFAGNAARFGTRTVRAGARMVGQGMAENAAMGRPNLPSMLAEPRSSLFAVEPSALMPKPQAPVSELGFYSAAEQAALNLPRNKGTGQSFLNDLMKAPDVKKDELSWIGLDDFLKNKPNVTKQEVQDFIASNKIDLQEVRLGEPFTEDPVGVSKRLAIFDKYEPDIQALYKEMDNPRYRLVNRGMSAEEYNRGVVLQNRGFRGEPLTAQEQSELDGILQRLDGNTVKEFANVEEARKVYLAMSPEEKLQHSIRPVKSSTELQQEINTLQRTRDIEADKAYVIPEPAPAKHSRWQLAGGENYREILLKLPNKAMEESAAAEMHYRNFIQKGGEPNWAELPVETQQSIINSIPSVYKNLSASPEYRSSHFDEPNILAHIRVNDRIDADGKKMLLVEELQSDWHQAGRERGYAPKNAEAQLSASKDRMAERGNEIRTISSRMAALNDSQLDEFNALAQERQRLQDLQGEETEWGNRIYDAKNSGVPDAPFKDTWYQLSLKRILKYAADNGYERVGLTTGKQQIDRFSNELRQNVDEITFQTGLKLTPSEAAELQALRQQQTYMTGTERARYEYLSSNEGEYVGKGETKIKAFKGSKPTFSGTVKDGKFIDGQAQGKTVEEVLGKTMAKQIAEKQTGVLKGDNLTVGGEGMKAYYDEIYPKFLEKYGKKWDAGVGETKVRTNEVPYIDYVVTRTPFSDFTVVGVKPDGSKTIINQNANSIEEAQKLATAYKDKNLRSGEPIRYIDITPKMKEGVKKGQPLAAAEQTPEMLASGGLDYADPFRNPLLESSIG